MGALLITHTNRVITGGELLRAAFSKDRNAR